MIILGYSSKFDIEKCVIYVFLILKDVLLFIFENNVVVIFILVIYIFF